MLNNLVSVATNLMEYPVNALQNFVLKFVWLWHDFFGKLYHSSANTTTCSHRQYIEYCRTNNRTDANVTLCYKRSNHIHKQFRTTRCLCKKVTRKKKEITKSTACFWSKIKKKYFQDINSFFSSVYIFLILTAAINVAPVMSLDMFSAVPTRKRKIIEKKRKYENWTIWIENGTNW